MQARIYQKEARLKNYHVGTSGLSCLPVCSAIPIARETGEMACIDTSARGFNDAYTQESVSRERSRSRLFRSLNIDEIVVSTDGSYIDEIVKFFMKRRKKR